MRREDVEIYVLKGSLGSHTALWNRGELVLWRGVPGLDQSGAQHSTADPSHSVWSSICEVRGYGYGHSDWHSLSEE